MILLFLLLCCWLVFNKLVVRHSSKKIFQTKWMLHQLYQLILFRLTLLTENDDKTLQFCRNIGMFPKDVTCPNCGVNLEKVYKIKNGNTTHFRYHCNKCMCRGKKKQNTVTLRGHAWFNESKISIRKSLFITYCFIYQLSYKDTIRGT